MRRGLEHSQIFFLSRRNSKNEVGEDEKNGKNPKQKFSFLEAKVSALSSQSTFKTENRKDDLQVKCTSKCPRRVPPANANAEDPELLTDKLLPPCLTEEIFILPSS